PTAINASRVGSRASSSIWSVPNCISATLSASTPEALRMTRSNAAFAGVRPITPTLCPARSAMSLIFGAGFLLELLSASPEGAHSTTKVFTHDGDGLRVCQHLQIATTDRKVGLASTEE